MLRKFHMYKSRNLCLTLKFEIYFDLGDNLSPLRPWEHMNSTNINTTTCMEVDSCDTEIGGKFEIFFTPLPIGAFMGLTITSLILAFVAFALLLHLALFHIYINYVGITTYEYVRAHRLAMDQSLNQSSDLEQSKQEDQTTDSKCCQMFSRKAKVEPTNTTNQSLNHNTHKNGLKRYESTVEKLPPIHPINPQVRKEETQLEKPKGSSVPKLPKLVELENGSGPLGLATATRPRPHLAKVHKHLESVDFEDQDKIFVVEVS